MDHALDAAVAVEAFLQRHLRQQVVDGDGHRLLDQPVELDRPGPDLQRLRLLPDLLEGAELVVVVVGGGEVLRRERPVEGVGRVLLHRIEVGRGVLLLLIRERRADSACEGQRRARREQRARGKPLE